MRNAPARTFAVERLEISLARIQVHANCARDVIAALNSLLTVTTREAFFEGIKKFRSTWRSHLARVYFQDYERVRWDYFRRHVVECLLADSGDLGLVLDVGCGRGCITAQLVAGGLVKAAVGIDAVSFDGEWNERRAAVETRLSFEHVGVAAFDEWLATKHRFDTIFFSYVLHHSEEFWALRTLRSALSRLPPKGRIVILEDSFGNNKAKNDPFHLVDRWRELSVSSLAYGTTPAFDVQVILDFVAVQLLAQFDEVAMPCNYRRMDEWEAVFQTIGAKVELSTFIGFPADRDIDVPQALFVISPRDALR